VIPLGHHSNCGISYHQLSWRYEDGPWKGPRPPLLVAADLKKRIFNLCFIGSEGFDYHLIDSSLAVSCSAW
jgi:hypothetical protein